MSSILEKNFNQTMTAIADLVDGEVGQSIGKTPFIIVQVAYDEESFQFHSAALTPSDDGVIPSELTTNPYYNMVLVVDDIEEVYPTFRDKYLFKLAYSDISFALYTAYRNALMSENGEYTLHTSFFKPTIGDSSWAYNDVLKYSDLGHFGCWFNFDKDYKQVDIQADNDLIAQYAELKPARRTLL
ncbi:MAG: hypothetical protein LUH22_20265 [Bacteroides sp.]|nr:hypothetical protein [Bacteroides sp.]